MEDERIVPALVSVYKDEVWRHLGFCGNVRPGTGSRRLPCPMWKAFARGAAGGRRQGRCAAAAFSRVGGVLCSWGGARVAVSAILCGNINTNWKTCEIQVERFWECSTSVFILFTFVLFSLGIQQALYFSLILSRYNCLLRSKCYDIVYYNCKLKLWTFKAGSKNIYGLFYKIHFIHTFK